MTGSNWRWLRPRSEGVWRHGAAWARPLVAAAPWVTLALILAMFALIGDRLAIAPGVLFDLPDPVGRQSVVPGLTALVLPSARGEGDDREIFVFFDDARYTMGDDMSVTALRDQLSLRLRDAENDTLLLLADKRIPSGELMRIVGLARDSGVGRVQIAEKQE